MKVRAPFTTKSGKRVSFLATRTGRGVPRKAKDPLSAGARLMDDIGGAIFDFFFPKRRRAYVAHTEQLDTRVAVASYSRDGRRARRRKRARAR